MASTSTAARKTPTKRPLTKVARKRLLKKHAEMGKDPVSVTIKGDDANVTYKIKRWVPLSKVGESYAARKNLDPLGFIYLYEGQSFHPTETPYSMGMRGKIEIEVRVYSITG